MKNETYLPVLPDPCTVNLPLNAKIVMEQVRRSIARGTACRVMEDNYFVVAETDIEGHLNESEIDPYFTQLCQFLDGDPVSPEAAVTRRVMACHREHGFVYVFESPGFGFKIGFSKNPENRFKSIRRKHPGLVKRMLMAGNKATESLVHSLFRREKQIKGKEVEWFGLNEDDLVWLAKLCSKELTVPSPIP